MGATFPAKPAWSAWSFLAALVVALLVSLGLFFSSCQRYLEFSVTFPGEAWAHIYPSMGGDAGHLKYKGVKVESSGRPVNVRIPLLPIALDALLLRIDNPGGTVSIGNIRLVNGRGELLARIGRDSLENSAASTLAERDGVVELSPTGLSRIIDLRLNLGVRLEPVPDGAFLLFLRLFLPALAIAGLAIAGGRAACKLAGKSRPGGISPPADTRADHPGSLLAAAGVFLIVLGARLWLVQAFGSDLPFWDQWGAEATRLYIPYFRETLSLGDLFAPHNEHRILLTRIFSLGLLLLNGTWDPLLQMALNALLYASVSVFVLRTMVPTTPPAWCVAVALLFALPCGWQNTLGGFQLQMYLMIGLSFLFLWCMTCPSSSWWRWGGGCLSAVLLLFTMASGFLACAAFLVTAVLLSCRSGGSRFRELLPAMLLCSGVVVAGMLLKVTFALHQELQAGTADGFALAAASYLGWPLSFFPIFGIDYPGAHAALFCSAILLWLPFMILCRRFMLEPHPSATMTLVVSLGFWTLLQVAAAAYARGANIYPSSRYQDIFLIGLLVNIASLFFLRDWYPTGRGAVGIFMVALLWTMGSSAGLLLATGLNVVHDLPEKRAQQNAGREHVRRFIASGDIESLSGKPRFDIPHYDWENLALLLVDPDVRRILPPTVTGSGPPGRLRPVLDLVLRGSPFIAVAGIICLAMIRRKDKANCCRDRGMMKEVA